MKKQLVLHFGMQRTGTTTIQNTLKKNKGILKSHGIMYPALLGLPDHVKIPWWLKNNKITVEELMQELEKIKEDYIHTVVLSAEDFSLLDDFSFLKKLQEKYILKVVVYLKEQSSWLESWYNQHIKWPWNKKFSSCDPEFFIQNMDEFKWIDYNATLDKITSSLDQGNIIPRCVSSQGIKDTTKDFFDILGMDVKRLHAYRSVNESLTKAELEIVRRLDLMDMPPSARTNMIQAVREMEIDGDSGSKTAFTYEQRKTIVDHFKESNLELFKKYFDGENLFDNVLDKKETFPFSLTDDDVYKKYIPRLCKLMAGK